MRRNRAAVAAAVVVFSCGMPALCREPDLRDRAVLAELNALRADPAAYAAKLAVRRPYYQGRLLRLPGQVTLQTSEGVRALEEAIRALHAARPVPALALSPALRRAAVAHARDIGPAGLTSHRGSRGESLSDRIGSNGAGSLAEVISFGPDSAASVVVELLIDDGVPDRGHRRILLDPAFRLAGAALAPHKTYGTVCVIDLADRLGRR